MLEQLLLEFLDNEVEFLLRLADIEFLRELRPFLRTLEADPRLRSALAELRHEAVKRGKAHFQKDAETVKELLVLRNEFVQLAPEQDDSQVEVPDGIDPWDSRMISLARFDRIAAAEIYSGRSPDFTKTAVLIPILEQRIEALRFPIQGADGEPKTRPKADQRPVLGRFKCYWPISGVSTSRGSAVLSGRTVRLPGSNY